MEKRIELVIHQTLHGYADGHMLLASSCDLSVAEKRALIIMSDLSGGNPDQNFYSYLTGYPLPGNRYYALGRTWYAPEMKRPGCVWTQTLLISLPLLGRIKQLEILNYLFLRPTIGITEPYNRDIIADDIINSDIKEYDYFENLLMADPTVRISDYLYSLSESSIIVPAKSADIYEKSILAIWSLQWPRLRRSFSFCTGSLSMRKINGKLLDCQIIPKSSLGAFLRHDVITSSVVNFDLSIKSDLWLTILQKAEKRDLSAFLHKYGSDLTGGRKNFKSLCLAFQMNSEAVVNSNSLYDYIVFFNSHFPNAEDARRLKKDLLLRKINQDNEFDYYTIIALIESFTLINSIDINWQLGERIISSWKAEIISIQQVENLLQVTNGDFLSLQDKFILLSNLPINIWLSVNWLSVNLIKNLLEIHPHLIESQLIWQSAPYDIQKMWFTASQHIKSIDWVNLLKSMIEVNNVEWINQVVVNLNPQMTASLLGRLIDEGYNFSQIKYLIANLIEHYIIWLGVQANNSVYTYKFVCELLLNSIIDVKQIPKYILVPISNFILSYENSLNRTKLIASFLMHSFQNELFFSNKIVEILFQSFYNLGIRDNINQNVWEIILTGREEEQERSYSLFSWFFEQYKPNVAFWDKCGKLRQMLVESFILYRWEESSIIKIITDRIVFKQIVDYCLTFSSGVAFLIRLHKSLELKGKDQKTFHFEVVSDALKRRRVNKKKK